MPRSKRHSLLRFVLRHGLRLLYGLRITGEITSHDAAPRRVIALNHVSFIDPLAAYVLSENEPVFAIDTIMAAQWWVKPVLLLTDAHCIDPAHPFALRTLIRHAAAGRTVIIFPEGRLTVTGGIMKIYGGAASIALKAEAALIPVHISGWERTGLTRLAKGALPRQRFPRLQMRIGRAVLAPEGPAACRKMREHMRRALEYELETLGRQQSLHATIADALAAQWRLPGGRRSVLEDQPVEGGWSLRRLEREAQRHASRFRPDKASRNGVDLVLAPQCDSVARLLGALCAGQGVVLSEPTLRHAVPARTGSAKAAAGGAAVVCADGTALTDADILSACRHLDVRLPLTRMDKIYTIAPMTSQGGLIAGLFWPLLAGAKLFLQDGSLPARIVADAVYVANVTVLIGDDASLRRLAEAADPYDFHAIRLVVAWGGVHEETQHLFASRFGRSMIVAHLDEAGRLSGFSGPGLRRQDGSAQDRSAGIQAA